MSLWIKRPFEKLGGEEVGDKNFDRWYEKTNIRRPIVRCRVCGKKTQSYPADENPKIPCTWDHKNKKGKKCWCSGMPGIIVRKL